MGRRGLIVAIDGPAGAGKSTAARALARRLGYLYLDTGATFRAVALRALRAGVDLDDEEAVAALARAARIELVGDGTTRVFLDGEEVTEAIRTPEVSRAASRVAVHPEVRRILQELWRSMARDGGVVLEGRDIGTAVFPDAEVKFYLDARDDVRAERRFREQGPGGGASLERVREELARRDEADRSRRYAPLRQAPDAIVVDTTELDPDETVDRLEREVRARMAQRRA